MNWIERQKIHLEIAWLRLCVFWCKISLKTIILKKKSFALFRRVFYFMMGVEVNE